MKTDETKGEKPLRIKLRRAGHKMLRLDRPFDPERRDLPRQVDPVERPEQGHLPHVARTRTVSPTTLSIWWSVS